jgi:putative selenate reductase
VDDVACSLPEAVRATIVAVRDDYGYLLARK